MYVYEGKFGDNYVKGKKNGGDGGWSGGGGDDGTDLLWTVLAGMLVLSFMVDMVVIALGYEMTAWEQIMTVIDWCILTAACL